MLLIAPLKGTWPEPRPYYLVTGDRVVQVLDTQSLAALQTAGVKVSEMSKASFSKLLDELTPETMEGLDPVTGKLVPAVMPDYLSTAAIADVDIRGTDGKVEEQYLPARLSPENLQALMASSGGTSTTSATSDTATIGTANITNATITTGTVTNLDTTFAETSALTMDRRATPPSNPAGDKIVQYTDSTGRVIWRTDGGLERRASSKRIVTSWPSALDSVRGDEAILDATGEHRIYLGASKGWRHVGVHTVATVEERNALTHHYPGMRVFCAFGHEQDHVWKTDNKWHGTQPTRLGATLTPVSGVQDTNWRRFATATVIDPGYDYFVHGRVSFEIQVQGTVSRPVVQAAMADYTTGTNWQPFELTYSGTVGSAIHRAHMFNLPLFTYTAQQGSRHVVVDWRMEGNWANARVAGLSPKFEVFVVPA